MQGFDPKFRDFPDYILKITEEIWEGHGIATLHQYYAPNVIVRTPRGITTDNAAVIAGTMAGQAEFPDRTLLGEDVIWSGSPEQGMLSSHRLLCKATHEGNGYYGKASGTKLTFRVIADCHAVANRINDEWLVRDEGAIVRQLGWTSEEFARDLIGRQGGPSKCPRGLDASTDIAGPYLGTGNDDCWGTRYADLLTRIMGADFASIAAGYDRACQLEYPGGVSGHSPSDAEHFWIALRSSFPDARFEIIHVVGLDDPLMPPRAAVRWLLRGKHSGWGRYGAPSGAEMYIMGINHAEFGPFGNGDPTIRREYVLVDEVAIWKQILLHSGDV